MHLVPEAMGWTMDQEPLAHCWNELPPIQFHSPSVVQGPVSAPLEDVEPEEDDPVDAGAAELATGAEEATEGAATDDAGCEDATGAEVGAVLDPEDARVMKTPPELLGATEDDPPVGAAAAAEEPPAADEPPVAAAPQPVPDGAVAVLVLSPAYWTESPGSGNMTSADSRVWHCEVGMLAMNMSGKPVARLVKPGSMSTMASSSRLDLLPPVTVTGAQFMYISRLPTLLNQVHAST